LAPPERREYHDFIAVVAKDPRAVGARDERERELRVASGDHGEIASIECSRSQFDDDPSRWRGGIGDLPVFEPSCFGDEGSVHERPPPVVGKRWRSLAFDPPDEQVLSQQAGLPRNLRSASCFGSAPL
jgi:hypothetical protein